MIEGHQESGAFAHSTPRGVERLFRRAVLSGLGRLEAGRLEVVEGGRRHRFGRAEPAPGECSARIDVLRPRFWRRIALGGTIGAAESYADGDWTTDDLTAVVRIAARDLAASERLEGGWTRLLEPVRRLGHLLDSLGRSGARRSIAAHYDLGDDFFAQFLDPTMMYSAAYFERPEATLEEASLAKLDLVCRKLRLGPDDHLVEIGTGWGGLALHAARRYGCRVTTTTISERQLAYARRRIDQAGLSDRVRVLDRDYRDLPGAVGRRFSKLVSIEMIEAVVHRDLDRYFGVVSKLLQPDGLALVQAITIPDQRYDAYRRSVDFIQRHIFPGGQVPAISAITASMKRATDLTLTHLEDLTPHYATTLERWREAFLAHRDRIAAMGYPERFRRLWEFYLCYCEGGFLERAIGDVHLLFAKPLWRGEPIASAAASER